MRPGPVKDESRSGKCLLSVSNNDVDGVWPRIKEATEHGRLGCEAKAATAANQTDRGKHVICVYTLDWRNNRKHRIEESDHIAYGGRAGCAHSYTKLARSTAILLPCPM